MKEKIIDKNYGSIPHLSTSKLNQQADKKINEGQEKILTKKARDYNDLIIVTEKLDGSNVGIINKNGSIKAITRSGYEAIISKYKQHIYFDLWVKHQLDLFEWLPKGYRICGEWMAMSHGTIYDIKRESPFIAFDIIDSNNERLCYLDFLKLCSSNYIASVPLLHIGQPISIKNALKKLGKGSYGICHDSPEGFVYRCERKNKVDFLAKWVKPNKEDGKYLKNEVWNIGFDINNYIGSSKF